MKRIAIRLGALSAVVGAGIFAITQAQRSVETPPATETQATADALPPAPTDAGNSKPRNDLFAIAEESSPRETPSQRPAQAANYTVAREPLPLQGLDDEPGRPADPFAGARPIADAQGENGVQESRSRVQVIAADEPIAQNQPTPAGGRYDEALPPTDLAPSAALAEPVDPPTAGTTAPASRGRYTDTAREPTPAEPLELPARTAPAGGGATARLVPRGLIPPTGQAATEIPTAAPAAAGSLVGSQPGQVWNREFAGPSGSPTLANSSETSGGQPTGARNVVSPVSAAPISAAPYGQPTGAGGVVGQGVPGDRALEGPQTPSLTIQQLAPAEIQVGKPAVFEVRIRNSGRAAASNLMIHDEVPRGTQLVRTTPQAQVSQTGEITWTIASLPAGEDAVVSMEIVPQIEGEIGSVATVSFAAQASARTVATRPQLAVKLDSPETVMIGQPVSFTIQISNTGTGAATGVVLEADVPPQLQHPAGDKLEYEVGTLKPNETRELTLVMQAAQPGRVIGELRAHGDGDILATDQSNLEVLAPALEVAVEGPGRRYLNRQATYTVSVANPGTAAAKDVEVLAYLSEGLQFVQAEGGGRYDESRRTVRWRFEQLPAGQAGQFAVTALPIEAGEHKLMAQSSAQGGLVAEQEQIVQVEAVAAIGFSVIDAQDPIEVGADTSYEIHVVNQGSKNATNVRIVAEFPPQMKPVDAAGPTAYSIQGQQVIFEPLGRLAVKADTTYKVRGQGIGAGDLRFRVQLVADEMQAPVIKEESTRVYSDKVEPRR